MKTQITKKENLLLHEIIDSEVDGKNTGYSEFDGLGLNDEDKGVLSSLIKKGLVYNSNEDLTIEEGWEPMYCTTELINSIEVK